MLRLHIESRWFFPPNLRQRPRVVGGSVPTWSAMRTSDGGHPSSNIATPTHHSKYIYTSDYGLVLNCSDLYQRRISPNSKIGGKSGIGPDG